MIVFQCHVSLPKGNITDRGHRCPGAREEIVQERRATGNTVQIHALDQCVLFCWLTARYIYRFQTVVTYVTPSYCAKLIRTIASWPHLRTWLILRVSGHPKCVQSITAWLRWALKKPGLHSQGWEEQAAGDLGHFCMLSGKPNNQAN